MKTSLVGGVIGLVAMVSSANAQSRSQLSPEYRTLLSQIESVSCVESVAITTDRHSAGDFPVFVATIQRDGGASSSQSVANCARLIQRRTTTRIITTPANVAFKLNIEANFHTEAQLAGWYSGRADSGERCAFEITAGSQPGEYRLRSSWGLLSGQSYRISKQGERYTNPRSDRVWVTVSSDSGPGPLRGNGRTTGLTVQPARAGGAGSIDHCILR